jgi:hypothetical protein
MRLMMMIGLAFILSVPGLAQTTTSEFYDDGNSILDSSGNLFVFDFGRSTTGVTVTGLRRTFFAPKTRVTVQKPGTTGNIKTVEYDAALHVIGVGNGAVFAVATVYTVSGTTLTASQSLIALRADLPAGPSLSGFTSFNLTGPVEARLGPSDNISLVLLPDSRANSSETTTSRTAQVVHFNGTSFEIISSGTLP